MQIEKTKRKNSCRFDSSEEELNGEESEDGDQLDHVVGQAPKINPFPSGILRTCFCISYIIVCHSTLKGVYP